MNERQGLTRALALLLIGWMFALPEPARAHCDGLDGPVVTAARNALAADDVNLVLVWVREEDEPEVRDAFDRTREIRKLGTAAREFADRYFFETLVRVHREGEGEPYTGLQPAGRDLGPAIPLADRALESGGVDALVDLVTAAMRRGVVARYERAIEAKDHDASDVAAGRAFVHAYVAFVHFAERAHALAAEPVTGDVEHGTGHEHEH